MLCLTSRENLAWETPVRGPARAKIGQKTGSRFCTENCAKLHTFFVRKIFPFPRASPPRTPRARHARNSHHIMYLLEIPVCRCENVPKGHPRAGPGNFWSPASPGPPPSSPSVCRQLRGRPPILRVVGPKSSDLCGRRLPYVSPSSTSASSSFCGLDTCRG